MREVRSAILTNSLWPTAFDNDGDDDYDDNDDCEDVVEKDNGIVREHNCLGSKINMDVGEDDSDGIDDDGEEGECGG